MYINKLTPDYLNQTLLNKMDVIAQSQRPQFVKACLLFPLSGAALATNVATTATEVFHLLGKLSLAGVKYGVIGTIRLYTWSNAFQSIYMKLPDGKSLLKTLIKVGLKALGIFYSLLGLAFPRFNLRLQAELGNFIKKPHAPPEPAPLAPEPNTPAPSPQKVVIEAKDPDALKKHKVRFLPIAKMSAALARGIRLKERKAKEAQKSMGRKAAADAAAQANRKAQELEFLQAFQIVEHTNTSLPPPKKQVTFAPESSLVQIFPIPKNRNPKMPPQQTEKLPLIAETSRTASGYQESIGDTLTLLGSAFIRSPHTLTGASASPVASDIVQKAIPMALKNGTSSALSTAAQAIAAPAAQLVQASMLPAMTNSSLVASASNALAAPALTVAQIAKGSVPSIWTNATSSLISSASNALAAPALTLAQMAQATVPYIWTNATSSVIASAYNAVAAPAIQLAQGAAPTWTNATCSAIASSAQELALPIIQEAAKAAVEQATNPKDPLTNFVVGALAFGRFAVPVVIVAARLLGVG